MVTTDLWYTLIYQTPADRRAYERDRRAAWGAAGRSAALRAGRLDAFLREHDRERHRIERTGGGWSIDAQVDWAATRWGSAVGVRSLRRNLSEAFGRARIHLAPGALEALDELRASGVRIALVSNIVHETPASVRRVLDRLGIAQRVATVVLSSEIGHAKPSPIPVLEALRVLEAGPEEGLHIGDLGTDRAAAWAAGVPAIRYTGLRRWLPPTERPAAADPEVGVPSFDAWSLLPQRLPALYGEAREALRAATPVGPNAPVPRRVPPHRGRGSHPKDRSLDIG